jgi:hypothetical protein
MNMDEARNHRILVAKRGGSRVPEVVSKALPDPGPVGDGSRE